MQHHDKLRQLAGLPPQNAEQTPQTPAPRVTNARTTAARIAQRDVQSTATRAPNTGFTSEQHIGHPTQLPIQTTAKALAATVNEVIGTKIGSKSSSGQVEAPVDIKGLKLIRRTEITGLGTVTMGVVEKLNWSDEKLKGYPGIRLEIYDDHELRSTAEKVLTDLCTGVSEQTAARILLLAWNIRSHVRLGASAYSTEKFFHHQEDVEIDSLSNVTTFKGSTSAPNTHIETDDLVRAMCFISASLLRLFSKDPKNYVLAYDKHLKEAYCKFYKMPFPLTGFTPDAKCIEGIAVIFTTLNIFKGTLGRFLYSYYDLEEEKGICTMLFEQHLGMTGMHAVGLFIRACVSLPCSPESLLDTCWHNSTKEGLKTIAKIMKEFILEGREPGKPHVRGTWKYARLYDPEYFASVQTKNCKALVCTLATIAELTGTAGNQNIMDIAQLQSLPESTKELYRTWAKRIHMYFTGGVDAADACKSYGVLQQSSFNVEAQHFCQSALSGQTSMLNAIRCMSTRLFIGGLSYGTDDQSLKEAFSSYGDVEFARVIVDRETGKSKGFGFVNYHSEESASSALSAMDGQELNGRSIRVSYAQERERATNTSFRGGRGGGYGNRDEY